MKSIAFVLISICTCSALMWGQVRNVAPQPGFDATKAAGQSGQKGAEVGEDFTIGPEDVLGINVWREPDLTVSATVRPDGKIGIPLLNDVQAAGLTTQQLQEHITQGLSRFVADPHVSVLVLQIHSQIVYVMGSVGKPGVYALGSPLTVLELLVKAGGLAEFAKAKDIQIVRKDGAKTSRFFFNYKSFVEGKDSRQNISLKTGDVVIVP
jgi:polysaccharide biosynthesis/export protein